MAAARTGGLDFAAGVVFLAEIGVVAPGGWIADDFDEPLPEDFVIKPMPSS